MSSLLDTRITRIEKAILRGRRPRSIGHNARLPGHGPLLTDSVVKVYCDRGIYGIGWSRISRDEAETMIGKPLSCFFRLPDGVGDVAAALDLPLWDLVAKLHEVPLYQLLGGNGPRAVELYDGSIYIDDLDAEDKRAVEIFHEEVRSGQEHGYTNFKVKAGRGARWMPVMDGIKRDVLVVHAVREAAGPEAKILVDANMGNTLNTAKMLVKECEDVGIYWFEEPFAEDPRLNEDFKNFINESGSGLLVADGEFAPPAYFFDLVQNGWIDVVQHDFRFKGITWWRKTAVRINEWGALCGPHTWGSYIEKFHHAHFAVSVPNYSLLEAAPANLTRIVEDDWLISNGMLLVPDVPGAGFDVEPGAFKDGTRSEHGFVVPGAS